MNPKTIGLLALIPATGVAITFGSIYLYKHQPPMKENAVVTAESSSSPDKGTGEAGVVRVNPGAVILQQAKPGNISVVEGQKEGSSSPVLTQQTGASSMVDSESGKGAVVDNQGGNSAIVQQPKRSLQAIADGTHIRSSQDFHSPQNIIGVAVTGVEVHTPYGSAVASYKRCNSYVGVVKVWVNPEDMRASNEKGAGNLIFTAVGDGTWQPKGTGQMVEGYADGRYLCLGQETQVAYDQAQKSIQGAW